MPGRYRDQRGKRAGRRRPCATGKRHGDDDPGVHRDFRDGSALQLCGGLSQGSSCRPVSQAASCDQEVDLSGWGPVPVFSVGGLTFGIVICNDSNYPEPARIMASQGATTLFVPTNNALPVEKADVVVHTRNVDIAMAVEHSVSVIRADVAGRIADLVSYGSSGIVDPDGTVRQSGQRLTENILVAEIDTGPRDRRRG